MRHARLSVAVAVLALAACVSVADYETSAGPQELGAAEIVAARQAAFHMSGAHMGNMRALAEGGGDPKSAAYAARGVARWARVLPTLFPANTAPITPSRARPEIWANKADFNAKAAAFAEAATRMADAAQSGDSAGFAAQWRATSATCTACHDLYQVPAQPRS
ncbi:MAG TPA: cytochrome c [Allosphingosinicella sp.]|nr:cytochrome c [Allosphingosinicella sp.]